MSTHQWTNPADGRSYITVAGDQVRVDARPPADHTPIPPAPVGMAMADCMACGKPLDATLALRGAHLLCLPTERAYAACLTICGTGRLWSSLHVVYRGERPGHHVPAEVQYHHTTTRRSGGVAA